MGSGTRYRVLPGASALSIESARVLNNFPKKKKVHDKTLRKEAEVKQIKERGRKRHTVKVKACEVGAEGGGGRGRRQTMKKAGRLRGGGE